MFKKFILVTAALIFAFGILFTSIWKTSTQTLQSSKVLAEERLVISVSEESTEEGTESDEKRVDYELTWPGILPDHFLYPIKMIRDRLWLWLTTEPLKKAELLLKFADKRIWSAQMLVEKGEVDLGISTATKAEKYLEKAIQQEEVARQKGTETRVFLENLSRATLKHEEVLLKVREKTEETAWPVIDNCLGYARQGYEQVKETLEGME